MELSHQDKEDTECNIISNVIYRCDRECEEVKLLIQLLHILTGPTD
jgi:hypothetical protein